MPTLDQLRQQGVITLAQQRRMEITPERWAKAREAHDREETEAYEKIMRGEGWKPPAMTAPQQPPSKPA